MHLCSSIVLMVCACDKIFYRQLFNCYVAISFKHHVPNSNTITDSNFQMVRHFGEQNGIKGAIGAMAKLPDYSVSV